jgi:hypothetical protein
LAYFPAKTKRGPYKVPEKMRTLQDMRNLIIEGYSYEQIMQQLHIHRRTFYRYLSSLFEDDRRVLAQNIMDEEVLNQMAICRDRLLKQRLDILQQIANNPQADFKARVEAHHLAGEIAAVVLKLYTDGPTILSRRHTFPRVSLTGKDAASLRLVEMKGEEQAKDYDELDHEKEEG